MSSPGTVEELVERLIEAARDTETQLHFGTNGSRGLADVVLDQARRAMIEALARCGSIGRHE